MKINNLYEVQIREKNTYTYIYCSKSKYNLAPSDLQPHYSNGDFGNVYLLALDII